MLEFTDRRNPQPLRPVTPTIAVDAAELRYYRREMFPAAGPEPWLDRSDALVRISDAVAARTLSPAAARLARQWVRDGCVVLPKFFDKPRLETIWNAYESAIAVGSVTPQVETASADDEFPSRTLDPHLSLPAFEALLRDPAMVAIVELLMGARAVPFQTIAGHKGSQQREHSDSIHMTSYPEGYLVGNWIAFEDIHPDSGPLVYYPGSHRLPYVTSVDVDIPVRAANGAYDYAEYHEKYEPAIAATIARHGLEPVYFTAKAGDVLLWHANLIHGGSPRRSLTRSRKSVVCHYFAAGCVTYHDLTGTPTRLELARNANRKRLRNLPIIGILDAIDSALRKASEQR